MIRAVTVYFSVTALSAMATYNLLNFSKSSYQDVSVVMAMGSTIMEEELSYEFNEYSIPKSSSTQRSIVVDAGVITKPVEEEVDEVTVASEQTYYPVINVTVASVTDADRLMEIYNSSYDRPDWDHKRKINIVHTLWDFLVLTNGYNEIHAAALIGNVMYEGDFGMRQSDYHILSSIEEARSYLGTGECGYGIVQWTNAKRQNKLLSYYESAHAEFPNDWGKALIQAECDMLLNEVASYGVFGNEGDCTTIEDAVGRVAVLYEKYDGCYEQWSSDNGVYHLVSNDGSGHGRLEYAINIYNYFMEE